MHGWTIRFTGAVKLKEPRYVSSIGTKAGSFAGLDFFKAAKIIELSELFSSSPREKPLPDDQTLLNTSPQSSPSHNADSLIPLPALFKPPQYATSRIPKNIVCFSLDEVPQSEMATTLQIFKNVMRLNVIYILDFGARSSDPLMDHVFEDTKDEDLWSRLSLPFQYLTKKLSPNSKIVYDAPLHLTLQDILKMLTSGPKTLKLHTAIDVTRTHIVNLLERANQLAPALQREAIHEEEMSERREAGFLCRWEAALYARAGGCEAGAKAGCDEGVFGSKIGNKCVDDRGRLVGLGVLSRYRVAVCLPI